MDRTSLQATVQQWLLAETFGAFALQALITHMNRVDAEACHAA